MIKKQKKISIPSSKEFTDEEGKKWIQTSTDDLFSIRELNEILESIEKDSERDKVILARIDFQKVNREYYDAALALQSRVARLSGLLKMVITDSRAKIERKNSKLKELIEYIKKLHAYISFLGSQGAVSGMHAPSEILEVLKSGQDADTGQPYEDVEEMIITPETAKEKLSPKKSRSGNSQRA